MAAYSLGGSALWGTITQQAAEQAAYWLGDMGTLVAMLVGAGIILMIITAIILALKRL